MNFPQAAVPSLEAIQARLTHVNWIAGERLAPTVPMNNPVCNPATGEVIAPQMATHPDDVERALRTAHALHQSGVWSNTAPEVRADLLDNAANHLIPLVPLIAGVESYHTGIVFSTTSFVNAIVWLAFKAAAGVLRSGYTTVKMPGPFGDVEVLRKPLGVAAAIVPWNSPAALAAHKVANALAAGCPVILKPSEWAPYSCQFLVDGLETAGLPAGLFQIVHGGGEVGRQLVGDARVRAVSFTGGLQGGRAVAETCAQEFKSVQLELGGNNAMVVLADADVEKVAEGIVAGMTTLNGQWCRALGRLIVHESIQDQVLHAALEKLRNVRAGNPLSPDSQFGPIANEVHKERLVSAINLLKKKGGQAHQPTLVPDSGFFLSPTLITGVSPEDTLEEIFGPVATVHAFKEDAEAIWLANQTPYGLGGYVYSQDEAHALQIGRAINTGGVKVNGVSLLELNVDAPRPAWGLSGLGEEGTLETFDVFCGKTVVGIASR